MDLSTSNIISDFSDRQNRVTIPSWKLSFPFNTHLQTEKRMLLYRPVVGLSNSYLEANKRSVCNSQAILLVT